MTKNELINAQKERGVTDSAVRTKHSCWRTDDPDREIFDLEVSVEPLDAILAQLEKLNVGSKEYSRTRGLLLRKHFRIYTKDDIYRNLARKDLKQLLWETLEHDCVALHVIYRVRLTTNRLILSSYARKLLPNGSCTVDVELLPSVTNGLQISYPVELRDKSDYAIAQLYADQENAYRRLIIEEYQDSKGGSRLIRSVRSEFSDGPDPEYFVGIEKKEYAKMNAE